MFMFSFGLICGKFLTLFAVTGLALILCPIIMLLK